MDNLFAKLRLARLRGAALAVLGLLAAAFAGAIGGVTAQNAGQFLTSVLSTDAIQVYRSTTAAVTYATPTVLSNFARGTALLYTTTGTTASTGTTAEQTLASYSLPASTLNTGTKLRVGASWTLAANTNSKTVKCYFGASNMSSGLLLTNNKNASCELTVTQIGAASQIVWGNMLVDVTDITGYVNAGTDSGASAITIKLTATQGSAQASDVILNDFYVERLGT